MQLINTSDDDLPVYLALSGGVGGAKLVAGLAQILPPQSLVVGVNTGDDFEHLGLTICPDLDTVLYTLAGVVHGQQGWGRADESFGVLDELKRLGGDGWFTLGDRDIALHLLRRELLARGRSLSDVSAELARRLGIATTVLPISDQPVRTIVQTDQGALAFQDYFVRLRCAPALRSIRYDGAAQARLAPGVRDLLASPRLAGVIVCPSNPYLSLAPMLAITELREALCALSAPVIAVSPIVAGNAIKGPTAKIMCELGVQPDAGIIAELYADFVDAVIIDEADAQLAAHDPRFMVAATVMKTLDQKIALARHCVAVCEKLRGSKPRHSPLP